MSASPFDGNHANPWTTDAVDLAELNARASDAIANAVARVRDSTRGDRSEITSASILVLGPAGAGKTHLFMRLRKKLGPRAVFVHLRPLIGTPMTPRYVLGEIVRQLDYETSVPSGTFRQLDALVGATIAYLRFEPVTFPGLQLDEIRGMPDGARRHLVEWAVEQLVRRHPQMDESYAQRLLEVPFATTMADRRARLAWLAGRDLDQGQMQRLGLARGLTEERIVPALQTLALLATPGAPIVMVFDQLENLMGGHSAGVLLRDYANLLAELFDTMRGVVLVQMALDAEWETAILPKLGETQKTRLAGHVETLALPTPAQKRELVRLWTERLPGPRDPFPAPFGEKRLARWCATQGMTPRMLMLECKKALDEGLGEGDDAESAQGPSPALTAERACDDHFDAVAAAWQKHIAAARAALDDASADHRGADAARLVGGMGCAFRFVSDVQIASLDARQRIQVHLRKGARDFALALLHQKHHTTVAGVLDEVREAAASATVIVLREQAIDFPPTWKQTRARLGELTERGARFVVLQREDVARLLALESFLSAARSGDVEDAAGRALSERDVASWIASALDVASWSIVRALGDKGAVEAAPAPPEPIAPDAGVRPAVEACLAQLRVASVDRLVREVARVKSGSMRSDVLQALDDAGAARVRWFGRSIVAWRGDQA